MFTRIPTSGVQLVHSAEFRGKVERGLIRPFYAEMVQLIGGLGDKHSSSNRPSK